MKICASRALGAGLFAGLGSLILGGALAAGQARSVRRQQHRVPDPSAWKGSFRTSNYDYPAAAVPSQSVQVRPTNRLTTRTAPAYVAAVKKFIEKDMSDLVNDPMNWSPQQVGWYDMP